MLSHWYNHDNLDNKLKSKNVGSQIGKLDARNHLKVPDSLSQNFESLSIRASSSNASLSSTKSSSNLRIPWKIVVLGDASVGKSSLIRRFLSDQFSSSYNPTVEDVYLHNFTLSDGATQCIEILDTSGYHQFPAMRELNIRSGSAFVLVFDLTREESLKNLLELKQLINKIKQKERVPCVLVGNKSDLLAETENKSASASQLAREQFQCEYFLSSAKENLNTSKIFTRCVELISKDLEEQRVNESLLQPNTNETSARRNSTISYMRRKSSMLLMSFALDNRYQHQHNHQIADDNNTNNDDRKKDDEKCSRRFSEPTCELNSVERAQAEPSIASRSIVSQRFGSRSKAKRRSSYTNDKSKKERDKSASSNVSWSKKQKHCTIS